MSVMGCTRLISPMSGQQAQQRPVYHVLRTSINFPNLSAYIQNPLERIERTPNCDLPMRRKPAPHSACWHSCGFCRKRLPTAKGLRLHVQNAPHCRKKWEKLVLRPHTQAAESSTQMLDSGAAHLHDEVPIPMSSHADINMEDRTRSHTSIEDVGEEEEVARRYVEDYPGVVAEIIA